MDDFHDPHQDRDVVSERWSLSPRQHGSALGGPRRAAREARGQPEPGAEEAHRLRAQVDRELPGLRFSGHPALNRAVAAIVTIVPILRPDLDAYCERHPFLRALAHTS